MGTWTNGDIGKLDLTWNAAGIGLSAMIFQWKVVQGTPHEEDDIDVMADINDWIDAVLASMTPHIVVSYVMQGSPIYKRVGSLWNFVGEILPDGDGGGIGDALPSGVAALVTAATDTSRVMAKKYWPGLSELAQTAGLWIAAVLTDLATSALAWTNGHVGTHCTNTSFFPGVWSTKALGFKVLAGGAEVKDVPAYQRRRKAGVGV